MTDASRQVIVHDDFAALPADVASFLAASGADDLCLTGAWFDLLWQHSPMPGHAPRIYVVRPKVGAGVDCVFFAATAREPRRPRRLLSLTNFYTMTFAPILRPDLADVETVLDALAMHIARERPAWDVIELSRFVREDPRTEQMIEAFGRAGMLVDTYAQFENWFFPTNGVSAAQYFNTRPSQVRNTITRKLKKAQKERKIGFHFYESSQELAAGLADYEKIYAHSWKRPEAYPAFIPELMRCAAAAGSLRLGVLRVDDDPAAAQIWLVTGRRATIYKLAYDEKYAPLSVGSILTKMMFDRVLERDRVAEVDYGIGSEPYKLDWMSDCRHVIGVVCFQRGSVLGLLSAARHYGGHWGRRGLERARHLAAARGAIVVRWLQRIRTQKADRIATDASNRAKGPVS